MIDAIDAIDALPRPPFPAATEPVRLSLTTVVGPLVRAVTALLAIGMAAVPLAAGAQAASPAAPPAPPPLPAWLVGCWEGLDNTSAAGAVEVWLAPRAGQMVGLSQTVRGMKTGFEFMRIERREGARDPATVFIPQPYGRPPIEFTAGAPAPERLTFTNPQNDFPGAIDYRLESGQLVVGLGRDAVAAQASRAFQFRRVACETLFAPR